jgi:hypothetical protein
MKNDQITFRDRLFMEHRSPQMRTDGHRYAVSQPVGQALQCLTGIHMRSDALHGVHCPTWVGYPASAQSVFICFRSVFICVLRSALWHGGAHHE